MVAKVTFEPITESIGAYARVEDVLADGVPQQLLDALDAYDVVVIPESEMSDEVFAQMTAKMGAMHDLGVTAESGTQETKAGIYRIALDKVDPQQLEFIRGNDLWHMDGTVYDTPGKATLLKCVQAPSEGGDTGFTSLDAVWEALPANRKEQLASLKIRHAFRAVGEKLYDQPTQEQYDRWDAFFPPVEHPLVWHRKSGKTSLMIGSTAWDVPGMTHEDGAELINELNDFAVQDRFVYRHKWKQGDVVMFNNPGLLHRSYPYTSESGRLMHRTTIAGTEATH